MNSINMHIDILYEFVYSVVREWIYLLGEVHLNVRVLVFGGTSRLECRSTVTLEY